MIYFNVFFYYFRGMSVTPLHSDMCYILRRWMKWQTRKHTDISTFNQRCRTAAESHYTDNNIFTTEL